MNDGFHECKGPGCSRRVSRPTWHCCEPCRTVGTSQAYDIDHSPGCWRRAVERGDYTYEEVYGS